MSIRKIFAILVWPLVCWASAQAEVQSKLAALEIKPGTSRSAVESEVASALGHKSEYSAYGRNLTGGTVEYEDGIWVLEVVYKPGAPAPRIEVPGSGSRDLPPIDETVERSRLYRRE